MTEAIIEKDKLSIAAKVLKKARTEEEAVDSVFMQEAIAQVVVEIEAIINATVEAIESSSSVALSSSS